MPKPTVNSTTPVLAQGAVFEISTDGGTTYDQVPGLEGIPQMGSSGEFVDITDIEELTKVFAPGIRTPAAFELIFRRIGDNAVQDALRDAGNSNDPSAQLIKIRVTYRTGDILDVDVALNGFSMGAAEQGNAVQQALVSGQQASEPVWTKVA